MFYFVSSLKDETLYVMKMDNSKRQLEEIEKIEVGERIRDIIFNKKINAYLMILENSPSLGVFKIKN